MNRDGRLLSKTSLLARVQRHSAMATLFRNANQTELSDPPIVPGALPAVGTLSLHPILSLEENTTIADGVAEVQPQWPEPQNDSSQPVLLQPQHSLILHTASIGHSASASRQRPTTSVPQTPIVDSSMPMQSANSATRIQTSGENEDPRQVELRRLMELHEQHQSGNVQEQPTVERDESPRQPSNNVGVKPQSDHVEIGKIAAHEHSTTGVTPPRQASQQITQPALATPIRTVPVTASIQQGRTEQIRQVSTSASKQPLQTKSISFQKRLGIALQQSAPAQVKEGIRSQSAMSSLKDILSTPLIVQAETSARQAVEVGQDIQTTQQDVTLTATSHSNIQKSVPQRIEYVPSDLAEDALQPSRDLATESATTTAHIFERQPLEEALRVQPAYFAHPIKASALQREETRPAKASDAAMLPETEAKLRQVLERIPSRKNSEMGVELILPRRPRPETLQTSTQPVAQSTDHTLQQTSNQALAEEHEQLKEIDVTGSTTDGEYPFITSIPRPAVKPESQLIRADPNLLQLLSVLPPKTNIAVADNHQAVEAQPAVAPDAGDDSAQIRELRDATAATTDQQQIVQAFRASDLPADDAQENIEEQASEDSSEVQAYIENKLTEGNQSDLTVTDERFKGRAVVNSTFSGTVASRSIHQPLTTSNPLQRLSEEPQETIETGNVKRNGDQSQLASLKERESKEHPIDVLALAQEVYGQLKQLLGIERERMGK